MKVNVASLIIKDYQLEDLINILLKNNYIVEIKYNDENTVLVNAYTKNITEESEEE